MPLLPERPEGRRSEPLFRCASHTVLAGRRLLPGRGHAGEGIASCQIHQDPGGESLKIERRDDPQTQEHVITITLTREEMVRASCEMTPAEKQTAYLMSQSPLLSTQLCSLFEIASALEKADARAATSPDALMNDDED
ncbi:MAG: hypothetical protein QG575_1849 [Euryarchaeota archaeon]|nr:hypothetical protein [Euryarchaeota archaeon]